MGASHVVWWWKFPRSQPASSMYFSFFGAFSMVFSLCDGKRFKNKKYIILSRQWCVKHLLTGQNTQHLSKQNVILLATFNIQFFVCFSVLCVSQNYKWWTIYSADIVSYTGKSFFDCNTKKWIDWECRYEVSNLQIVLKRRWIHLKQDIFDSILKLSDFWILSSSTPS